MFVLFLVNPALFKGGGTDQAFQQMSNKYITTMLCVCINAVHMTVVDGNVE